MNKSRNKGAATIAAVFAALACCCTDPMQAGSETTSGVKISVLDSTIHVETAPAATVIVFDALFSPGDSQKTADTAIADADGLVAFAGLVAGTYNIFVFPAMPLQGAAVLTIPVQPDSRKPYADSADFAALRSVTGIVTRQEIPDSASLAFIIGSPFNTKTDKAGTFVIPNVPAGKYTVVARSVNRMWNALEDSAEVDFSLTGNSTVNVILELH